MILINLSSEQTAKAIHNSYAMGKDWGTKKQDWGNGMLNSDNDPRKTERVGQFGEQAFSALSGIPTDDEVREKGNQFDFVLPDGKKAEVKCRSKDYGAHLVRAYYDSQKSRKVVLKSDIYVFATMVKDSRDEKEPAVIALNGWATREEIESHDVVHARKGFHMNYELLDSELHDIEKLKKNV